ncbi:MAG: ATP-binding protein [Bryobacteraceae bacterium]|jgi:signal transduction histidine kinase
MPEVDRLAGLLLHQAPSCSWLVSAEGVFERLYGDCSGIFGKPVEDLAGRPVTEVLPRESARAWISRFSRALAGETLSLRERAGDTVWNISIFPVREGSAVCYAGAIGREISDWNKTENDLRQTVLGALKSQEFERKMASKFLHDTVGQNLTALGMQLDLVRMDFEEAAPEAYVRIGEIQKVLETIMEDVRDYSYELNPATVERAGLRPALDRLLTRMRERFNGSLRLNVDPFLKLDPNVAPALYQIAQEAIENAVIHSGCSSIEIAVKATRSGPALEVRDNGHGFDPAEIASGRRGLGLLTMEHYAAQAGLNLSIVSDRATGTAVRASLTGSA